MNRIMVIGVSAGVGKSTLAMKLGKLLKLPVYHLDTYFWKPGWIEATNEEFSNAQEKLVGKEKWIIEGNYTKTIHLRELHCDTIIYLEQSLLVCLYRVVKRFLKNIGKTRPDMTNGCKEKLDWVFIKFIITTYYGRREQMKYRLKSYELMGKKVIVLKTKEEIDSFFHRLDSFYERDLLEKD
jgi:adenylate kinase family enzyme